MTLQDLGALGEFVGAVGVIATLAYLAVQIRQNTKMLRSTIYSQWAQITAMQHEARMQHADQFGELYGEPGHRLPDLDMSQKTLHDAFFMSIMNSLEGSYLNYIDGAIDEQLFEAKHRNLVDVLASHPLFLQSWNAHKPGPWDARFVEYIDSEVIPVVDRQEPRIDVLGL